MATIYSQVKLATTENITLSVPLSAQSSRIDNVIVNVGDRILVKAQTDKRENGIYTINSLGVWLRTTDFALNSSQASGGLVFVTQGQQFADTGWILASDTTNVVGTDEFMFQRVTTNTNFTNTDFISGLTLRSQKGYPLTILELDNNFKYIANALVDKVDFKDFTGPNIVDRINELSFTEANLDANFLRGKPPAVPPVPDTIVQRDENGNIFANSFIGDLAGKASAASLADFATLAGNVTGVVQIVNGGTSANTAPRARENLRVVGIDGNEQMVGTLRLSLPGPTRSPLNIPSGTSPTITQPGDVWNNGTYLQYNINDVTYSIAHINSPAFTGTPTVPTPSVQSDSTTIANTQFVKAVKTQLIDPQIALKANIESPTLTGTPRSPTPPLTDISTRIATTEFTRDYFNQRGVDYYTKPETDQRITAATITKASIAYVDSLQDKWGGSRKFVQLTDPGSAAIDGDFWFKI